MCVCVFVYPSHTSTTWTLYHSCWLNEWRNERLSLSLCRKKNVWDNESFKKDGSDTKGARKCEKHLHVRTRCFLTPQHVAFDLKRCKMQVLFLTNITINIPILKHTTTNCGMLFWRDSSYGRGAFAILD